MEDNIKFDLPALMRTGNLDIRMVARNNLTLLVEDYYRLLSKFLKYVPMTKDTLTKISSQKNAESDDFRNMSNISGMLEDIGCTRFTLLFDEIASACKRGHNAFAADCAKSLYIDFDDLCTQIAHSRMDTSTDAVEHPEDANFENYGTQSLKKILQLLDYEESKRKLRILVVDDAPVIIKTISSVLSAEYKVYGMTDPTKIEEFLKQVTPELFLLDYKMPERNGFELVPIIRSFKDHKKTPIVFLTSLGTADHVSAAFALGACDYIVKPFQGNILREKVSKHIVRKKLF